MSIIKKSQDFLIKQARNVAEEALKNILPKTKKNTELEKLKHNLEILSKKNSFKTWDKFIETLKHPAELSQKKTNNIDNFSSYEPLKRLSDTHLAVKNIGTWLAQLKKLEDVRSAAAIVNTKNEKGIKSYMKEFYDKSF